MRVKHNNFRNCIEDTIACIAEHHNRQYEFLLSSSWGLHIDCEKIKRKKKIGGNMYPQPAENLLLKQYHGISFHSISKKMKNIECVPADCNTYLCAFIDAYWCPWDKGFHRMHNPGHLILIHSYDSQRKVFYCTDVFYEKEYQLITHSMMKRAFMEACSVEILKEYTIPSRTIVLGHIAQRMKDILNNIEKLLFLSEMILSVSFYKEVGRAKNYWHSRILRDFYSWELDRGKYILYLQYVLKTYYIKELQEPISSLEKIKDSWSVVRSKLVKYFSSKETVLRKEISENIIDIYIKERDTAKTILKSISLYKAM